MPIRDDDYQLPSWPPTAFNRDLWNSVFGDIGQRLRQREALEASFESLISTGIQASLDYIQVTVAPQVASLQASIEAAQGQIDQIIIDGVSPNSLKFGGQLPTYYATAQALADGLFAKVSRGLRINGKELVADVTLGRSDLGLANVDNTSDADKPISTAAAAALDGKADKAAVEISSEAEAQQGTDNTKKMTPLRTRQSAAAYNRWRTITDREFDGAASMILTGLGAYRMLRFTGVMYGATVAQSLNVRLSADNGATWFGSLSDYFRTLLYRSNGTNTGVDAPVGALELVTAVAPGRRGVFTAVLSDFNKIGEKMLTGTAGLIDSVPSTSVQVTGGICFSASGVVCNAMQILPNAGTAINGYVHIEGLLG